MLLSLGNNQLPGGDLTLLHGSPCHTTLSLINFHSMQTTDIFYQSMKFQDYLNLVCHAWRVYVLHITQMWAIHFFTNLKFSHWIFLSMFTNWLLPDLLQHVWRFLKSKTLYCIDILVCVNSPLVLLQIFGDTPHDDDEHRSAWVKKNRADA